MPIVSAHFRFLLQHCCHGCCLARAKLQKLAHCCNETVTRINVTLLSRDAALARYWLSAVRVCVRLSHIGVLSKRLGASSWFSASRQSLTYRTLRFKEIRYLRNEGLPSGTLFQTMNTASEQRSETSANQLTIYLFE